MPRIATALAALAVLLLTACATLPADVPRPPSQAFVDVAGTELARLSAAATPDDRRHLSGFRLLPEAAPALDARLSLARRAQRSLDVQYYLIADDGTGRAFLQALHDAAARGVRVRLLVDDLHVDGAEVRLAALAAQANAEVRLFNPLPARGGHLAARLLRSLHDFDRVNRRMHNKLVIADNAWAVTGGRNIGDEYFMRGDAANFVDMDLLSTGPVVRELSDLFDRFWNSAPSFPIASVADPGMPWPDTRTDAPAGPPSPQAARPALADDPLDAMAADLVFAPATLFADAPDKAQPPAGAAAPATAMDSTLQLFRSARDEVLIASPYFIPGPRGLALMREAVDQGVHLAVTTNSLAATDEPLAYWGYVRYRLDMLKMGVSVSELRPHHPGRSGLSGEFRSSTSRLHAKLGVVDRRWLLVGSMNMDNRSSRTNTELGLVIDSRALATQVAQWLQQRWAPSQYRLQLADAGQQVLWIEPEGDGRGDDALQTHSAEPHVTWLARVRLGLLSMFVPEALL
ncbi:phosphatidylserine/phosphatidylglycerophosphate/cardiolipin synthase family protein [Ideonella sp. A 288]|uniref:phospholipase D-like domain-containing protein n=1 Tax=Ideonella sp. A 288 TaxID=1962181 RepID=UPI001303CD9C|nr:phosphatidylserine/phosphatidylglycerophosphate/cardiolipin synthase family protein [Ideonella sp. A 288]